LPKNNNPIKIKLQCYCWISSDQDWIVYLTYSIYWLFIFANIYISCKTTKFLNKLINNPPEEDYVNSSPSSYCNIKISISEKEKQKIKKVHDRLVIFPKITIFLWIFPTINRMYEVVYYKILDCETMDDSWKIIKLVLAYLQGIVMSGRGFIYIWTYYSKYEKINKELKRLWMDFMQYLCCRKNSKKYLINEESHSRLTHLSS
jgi:hypothetical protein